MPRIKAASLVSQAGAQVETVKPATENVPAVANVNSALPACLQGAVIAIPPKGASGPYVQIVNSKAGNFTKCVQLGFQENQAIMVDGDTIRRIDAFHLIAADTLYTERATDGSIVACYETDPRKPKVAEDIQAVMLLYTPDGVFAATGGFRATRSAALKTMSAAIAKLDNLNAWAQVVGRFVARSKTSKRGENAGNKYALIDAETSEITASQAALLNAYFQAENQKPEDERELVKVAKSHDSRIDFMLQHVPAAS